MRKRLVVGYIRFNLTDDISALVNQMETWCGERKLKLIEAITVEAAASQPKFHRLLSSLRSKEHIDFVIAPSFCHLSPLPKFMARLAVLRDAGVGVGFVKENMLLPVSQAAQPRGVFSVADHFIAAEREARARAIRQSLKVNALYGRTQKQVRISDNVRREAVAHLQAGRSLRQTEKLMNRQISRTTLSLLRQELKKKNGSYGCY